MDTEPVPETILFGDDPRMICELLKREWSLDEDNRPTFTYLPEEWMTSARVAFVYVYQISRYNSVSTVDYSTLQRTSFIAVRLDAKLRPKFFEYMQEIYRILMANRRVGAANLGGYTYFEIINDRVSNDLTGWYTCTLDVKLTSYAIPIRSAGFGDIINKQIEDNNHNQEESL